ncbi:uncharacterized protein [Maniola hyperantus]|uniref:uncharacterized protein isoform X2 n=1 Tax=Aphantopus hyperantus TaxID=2795564 RepID=UPI00374A648D
MLDLDTCRIHSVCANGASNKSIDEISIKHNSDEHTLAIERFRKMLKIFTVDEELEKILESRNLQLRPSNATAVERVESLAEYFNKIIVDDQYFSRTTKSLSTDNVTL